MEYDPVGNRWGSRAHVAWLNNAGSRRRAKISSANESAPSSFGCFIVKFIYIWAEAELGDVKKQLNFSHHLETVPHWMHDIDGGIMVGSVDGYHWIPKWLRLWYCFQFVKKKRKERKEKALNTLRERSLFLLCRGVFTHDVMDLWGGREHSYPRWGL